jgi:NAD-dependent SIR2 family protein deacetylase
MVRVLMAQKALPSLKDRIVTLRCTECGHIQFDTGEAAHTPQTARPCSKCSTEIRAQETMRNMVSNPLVAIFEKLEAEAPRPAQKQQLNLEPETL